MRPSRLSPRRNAVADYLRIIRRDKTLSDEARRYLTTQAGALLREFLGASASELHRLRAALELLEVGRDRAQPWEVRGPANDRAARLLAGLGVRSRVERAVRRPRRPSARSDVFTHPVAPAPQVPDEEHLDAMARAFPRPERHPFDQDAEPEQNDNDTDAA